MNTDALMKKALPHLLVALLFIVATFTYFSPLLSGKVLVQGDINQWQGMSKEVRDFKEQTGETALWTNSMFSGMPTYQIAMPPEGNLLTRMRGAIMRLLPKRTDIILLNLFGFYLLMIAIGMNPWIGAIGAMAFTFSTYTFLILEAGHVTKAISMGLMAPVVAGVLLTYRGKLLLGAALAGIGMALNIGANHFQITYYLLLLLAAIAVVELIKAVKSNGLPNFAKASGILAAVFLLALAGNATRLITTYEYSKETIRGGSDLKEGKEKVGLDKEYALAWSYGKLETLTFFIPRLYGGASVEPISKDSEFYKYTRRAGSPMKEGPMYWGKQPFTGGPIYFGAVICFLFILGCFVVKGPMKWWIIAGTIISILLAWGKNFPLLTNILFDYFPMYNKFRVVSMALILAQFTFPLLGMLALHKVISNKLSKEELIKALQWTTAITGGIALFFAVMGSGILEFEAEGDERYGAMLDLLMKDRASLMKGDAFRSLGLVLISAGFIFAFIKELINEKIVIAAIGLLVIGDLWLVDKRYLNNDDFVSAKKMKVVFPETPADKQIKSDKDPHFRVFNMAVNTFNDASTSYHHKSIGGYHGAKLSRYQDLMENQIAQNNGQVLAMLNAKYYITPDANGAPKAQLNRRALGNAWFVSEVQEVDGAKAEMEALTDFKATETAIVGKDFSSYLDGLNVSKDSLAKISLVEYKPHELSYLSESSKEGLAVFSEVYYSKGWNAYLDGNKVDHIRANYVLRAMKIPAGKHEIIFKFEPASYATGEKIAYASNGLLILLLVGSIFIGVKRGVSEE